MSLKHAVNRNDRNSHFYSSTARGTRGSYFYILFLLLFRSECVPFRDNRAERRARGGEAERRRGGGAAARPSHRPPTALPAAAGVRMRGTKSNFRVQSGARANGNSSHPNPLHSAPSLSTSSESPVWTTRHSSKAEADYCTVRVYSKENTVLLTKPIKALEGADLTKICQISVNNVSLKS